MAWARDKVKLFSCHSEVRRCTTLKTFSYGWGVILHGPRWIYNNAHWCPPFVSNCHGLLSGLRLASLEWWKE